MSDAPTAWCAKHPVIGLISDTCSSSKKDTWDKLLSKFCGDQEAIILGLKDWAVVPVELREIV